MDDRTTLEVILDCIEINSIGFMYDYQKNRPMLTFTINRDLMMQLCCPNPEQPSVNPSTFEPVYTAFVFSNNSFFNRLTDHEYNIVISRIEDKLGKSIDQITFGLMNYFERKW